VTKRLYDPIKEQLLVLIEYINILNSKKDYDSPQEITFLLELIENMKSQCERYLNYQLLKQGRRYGNKER
jgi:hypothetical protein